MARAESGSIQQLGKNRWRVRVSGGNDPVTGKRIRLSKVVHGTKKDAIAERTRMQLEVGDVTSATKDMTLAQYLDEVYLPWKKNRVRETTYERVERVVRKHIIAELGHIKLSKLSSYTVETWVKDIKSEAVRKTTFKIFQQAVTQAYKWDIVQKNVFDKLDSPAYSPKEKTVADADLGGVILDMLMGTRIEAPILLQLSCGLRVSEAMAIDWEEIDFKTGKVNIWRNYQNVIGGEAKFFEPKTKNSKRTVTIPKGALARLLEIRCADGVMRFGALAVGDDGERMKPDSLRYRYKALYERKLPDQPYITLKNLRHSHATILLTQGVDLKTIADRLGHANIKTTAKSYLQHVDELDERASEAFDLAVKVATVRNDPDPVIVDFKQAKEA